MKFVSRDWSGRWGSRPRLGPHRWGEATELTLPRSKYPVSGTPSVHVLADVETSSLRQFLIGISHLDCTREIRVVQFASSVSTLSVIQQAYFAATLTSIPTPNWNPSFPRAMPIRGSTPTPISQILPTFTRSERSLELLDSAKRTRRS